MHLKTAGKTGYQILDPFFQKNVHLLHAGNDSIFQIQKTRDPQFSGGLTLRIISKKIWAHFRRFAPETGLCGVPLRSIICAWRRK
jgi:hypothetical protein